MYRDGEEDRDEVADEDEPGEGDGYECMDGMGSEGGIGEMAG